MITFRSVGSDLDQPRTSQFLEDDAEKNADVKVAAARGSGQCAFTRVSGTTIHPWSRRTLSRLQWVSKSRAAALIRRSTDTAEQRARLLFL
jgi:hypothetical protein